MHALVLALLLGASPAATDPVHAQVIARHDEAVARLRDWVALPSIAAEGLNTEPGVEKMMALLREAGFQHVERVPTEGKPGVFATLDAGASRRRRARWSTPPPRA